MCRELSNGYTLNSAVRTHMARGLAESSTSIDRAYYLLQTMSGKGEPVHVECLNVIITACALGKDLNRAYETYLEFEQFGVMATSDTYLPMLQIVAKAGRLDLTVSLLNEMDMAGLPITAPILEAVVLSAFRAGQLEEGMTFLKRSLDWGLVPSFNTMYMAIRALLMASQVNEAILLVGLCKTQMIPFANTLEKLLHKTYRKPGSHTPQSPLQVDQQAIIHQEHVLSQTQAHETMNQRVSELKEQEKGRETFTQPSGFFRRDFMQ